MKSESRFLLFTGMGVCLAHALVIGWLEWTSTPLPYTSPQEKLIVKTITLLPTLPGKVQKIPVPIPPPGVQKPVKIKKTPIKREKPPEVAKKKKNLNLTKEYIAKLQAARDNITLNQAPSIVLQEIGQLDSLRINGKNHSKGVDAQYYDRLAASLKEQLQLPQAGKVKIILTLDRMGKLVSMKIVSSENDYNRKFVETALEKLVFPPFELSFKGKKTHTFTITLVNDE